MTENQRKKTYRITTRAFRMIGCAVILVLIVGAFLCFLNYLHAVNRSKSIVKRGVEDVCREVDYQVREMMGDFAAYFAEVIDGVDLSGGAKALKERFDKVGSPPEEQYEFLVIDDKGIVRMSFQDKYIGKDLSGDEQTMEFLRNPKTPGISYPEPLRPSVVNPDVQEKYFDVSINDGKAFLRFGIPGNTYFSLIRKTSDETVTYRRLGNTGYLFIVDPTGLIIDGYEKQYTNRPISEGWSESVTAITTEKEWNRTEIFGEKVYAYVKTVGDCSVIGTMPRREMEENAWQSVLNESINLATMVILLIVVLFLFFRKHVVRMLRQATDSLERITNGDLSERVEVYDSMELAQLSDGINHTVDALKNMIEREAARIDSELLMARKIQLAALPREFPHNDSFRFYASMRAARKVGGDFYDFFFIDDDHFAIVIADVSDKGIPAAMFMMQAKARIRSRAMQGGTPAQILYDVNNALFSDNEENMFVTVWFFVIELSTGRGIETNAGHEHPAVYQNGSYRLLKYPHSPPLAMMNNVPYANRPLDLRPGDRIFVYTDGATESINNKKEQFGEDELIEALNTLGDPDPEKTVNAVLAAIDEHAGEEGQFDDITLCAFTLAGHGREV